MSGAVGVRRRFSAGVWRIPVSGRFRPSPAEKWRRFTRTAVGILSASLSACVFYKLTRFPLVQRGGESVIWPEFGEKVRINYFFISRLHLGFVMFLELWNHNDYRKTTLLVLVYLVAVWISSSICILLALDLKECGFLEIRWCRYRLTHQSYYRDTNTSVWLFTKHATPFMLKTQQ